MKDVLKNLREQSPVMILCAIAIYFGRIYIEKKIDSVNKRIDQVSLASLKVKTDLRGVERDALVELHEALTEWEFHLFQGPSVMTSNDLSEEKIAHFYDKALEKELAVKLASAKLRVLVSDPTIDILVYDTQAKVGHTFLPPMKEMLEEAIQIRMEAEDVDLRLKPIVEAEKKGALSPEMQERGGELIEIMKAVNVRRVALMKKSSERQLELYQPLIDAIADLKERSQALVYRKLRNDEIGTD